MLKAEKFNLDSTDESVVRVGYRNTEAQGVQNYLRASITHLDTSKDGHIYIFYEEEKYIHLTVTAKGTDNETPD